jgi:LacI family transcriptional regulator
MDTPEVTIKDVARLANVSVATVSRALNGRENVADAVRERVLAIASSLDYSPHHAARVLSSRRTFTVGVVLPDLPCEYYARLMCGIDTAARQRGLQLLVSGHHRSPEEQGAALRSMRGRVDGIVVMSPHAGLDVMAANLPASLPVLLLDSGEVQRPGLCSLRVDNHGGARSMVRHLVERGRRRIAFIAGREPNIDAAERLRGYRDGLAECLPGVEPWVVSGDFDVASGHRAGCELLGARELPDAVFAANDMMALGCLFAFNAARVRVPDDIALAGFDDSPLAQHMHPSLTTLRIDIGGFGAHALRLLLDRTADGEVLAPQCLQPELMVRESTGAAAQA